MLLASIYLNFRDWASLILADMTLGFVSGNYLGAFILGATGAVLMCLTMKSAERELLLTSFKA